MFAPWPSAKNSKFKNMRSDYLVPPAAPLRSIFTDEVLTCLIRCKNPSPKLTSRLEVLEASGPMPGDWETARRFRFLCAQKAAWETYLYCAHAVKLIEGNAGKELKSRLTSEKDDDFRSAMAECMACWFFGGKLQLPISPKPAGRDGKQLEFSAGHPEGDIKVEVKSPYRPRLDGCGWVDDSDILGEKVAKANKQFPEGSRNILFLGPELTVRLSDFRYFLVKAFIATEKIVIPINTKTGGPAGEISTRYALEGKFTRPIQPDKIPGFTRVSAVVSVEERLRNACTTSGEDKVWIDHDVLIVHNPNAKCPAPKDIWQSYPQFIEKNGSMSWSDGHPANA